MIRAFLFDLDGVLTDTSEFHFRAWQRLAHDLGIPFDRPENEALRGVSRRESLLLLLKGRPASEAQLTEWMQRKNDDYVNQVSQMTPADLLPGARELLLELRQAGYLNAIVSSSKNTPMVLDRLKIASLVDGVVDGNAPARSKPAPDLFLLGAQKLNLPPEQCVVVEDAAAGVDAGIAAGMRTVGLGPRERVGHADLVFPSLEGIHLSDFAPILG